MKNVAVAIVMMVSASSSFAQIASSGAIRLINMECSIPQSAKGDKVLGVGYSMTCASKSSALKGCALYSKIVYPNAKPKLIELKIKKQTMKTATLLNADSTIAVQLDKSNFTAKVLFGNSASMVCSEVK